jgi:hypothetical protein
VAITGVLEAENAALLSLPLELQLVGAACSLTICEREAEQPVSVIVQAGRLGVLSTLLGSLLGGEASSCSSQRLRRPLLFFDLSALHARVVELSGVDERTHVTSILGTMGRTLPGRTARMVFGSYSMWSSYSFETDA